MRATEALSLLLMIGALVVPGVAAAQAIDEGDTGAEDPGNVGGPPDFVVLPAGDVGAPIELEAVDFILLQRSKTVAPIVLQPDPATAPLPAEWIPEADTWFPQPSEWFPGADSWLPDEDSWYPDADSWHPEGNWPDPSLHVDLKKPGNGPPLEWPGASPTDPDAVFVAEPADWVPAASDWAGFSPGTIPEADAWTPRPPSKINRVLGATAVVVDDDGALLAYRDPLIVAWDDDLVGGEAGFVLVASPSVAPVAIFGTGTNFIFGTGTNFIFGTGTNFRGMWAACRDGQYDLCDAADPDAAFRLVGARADQGIYGIFGTGTNFIFGTGTNFLTASSRTGSATADTRYGIFGTGTNFLVGVMTPTGG